MDGSHDSKEKRRPLGHNTCGCFYVERPSTRVKGSFFGIRTMAVVACLATQGSYLDAHF
jgi:hypothetical protein